MPIAVRSASLILAIFYNLFIILNNNYNGLIMKLNLSDEFVIQRHLQGVRLVKPKQASLQAALTVMSLRDINQFPYSICITNKAHQLLTANDMLLKTAGLQSLKSSLGITVDAVCPDQQQVQKLIRNNDTVMQTSQYDFYDETADLVTQERISPICLKMPCYDEDNQLLGTFACSVLANHHLTHLAHAITTISATFMLNTHLISRVMQHHINGVHYTKREIDIIKLIVRGKSMSEIGPLLNLSVRTVQNYFETIKIKAGVASKTDFIELALPYFYRPV